MQTDYEPPMVIRKSRMPAFAPEPSNQKPIPTELYFTEEDDFPGWPIAVGLMAAAALGCWGLWHIALWAGRL